MRPLRITAVVCSATVALALMSCSAPPPSGREALAAAVSTTLPFSARLSGGFAPSQQGPTRAGNTPPLSPDTRIAIAELEKRATAEGTPEAQADLGVAYLVQGEIDRAIATIEDAAQQLASSAPWSDLSAAYLAKAEAQPERRIESLARALEAAERSLKVARSNEALFNRGLARDGLAPFTGSPAPWSEYTAVERDRAWREAASRHANDDSIINDARDQWRARRKELPEKLKAGDREFIMTTARSFPEASIEFLEREAYVNAGLIADAALLASSIHDVTRDPMTRDDVAAIAARPDDLIRIHQTYAIGFAQTLKNDFAGARRSFTEADAGFTRLNAPSRLRAQFQLARLDWREGKLDAAQRRLIDVERQARKLGYHVLLTRVLWERGLAFNRQWRLTEGLAALRESAVRAEASSQQEFAVSIFSNLADALRMLGDSSESWTQIGRALEKVSLLREPLNRYLPLYNAALFAGRQELNEAAILFQDAAVREATKAGKAPLTEALVQRALVNVRRGELGLARADFDQASQQLALAPPGAFKLYIGAELEIVRAQLGNVDESVFTGLQNAIGFFSRTEPGRVPRLYLLLARTPQARASHSVAENALRLGVDSLERQQHGVGDEALRMSFFDESWALFHDMVSLQVAAKDPAKAFEYAERSRARLLLAAAQDVAVSRTRSLAEIQSKLPSGVVMVHYATLADRVLIWTISNDAATLVERPIAEADLARLVERHRLAVREHRENRESNDQLYKLLIEPAVSALAAAAVVTVVPDGALQQLPFATLRQPASGRFLIEDYALLVSPSASFFVDARAAASTRPAGKLRSALLIGNPAATTTRGLPGAAAEVESAAKVYPHREVLVGKMATKDRFLTLAPGFDVIHFGGHALANPEFPLLSRLVFADTDAGEQSLFAHEIAKLRFPRTRVVVLAACSTAAGTVSRGEGVVSVARPFLGRGVPLVVASQWDVDDRATEQLTLAFHRELATSHDPIQALRSAQLTMLRSGDATQALPESWGAFVAVGTAAPW